MIAALLVFGLVFGGFGLYRYNLGRASASWPSVKGKITYSHASPHKKKTGHEYMPTVRYTYVVKGKHYTGTRITSSDEYQKTLSGAQNVLRQYPAGGEVAVYYDSSDPARSLLEVGLRKNVYVMLGGALACCLLALLIAVSLFKKRHSP
jgi:hypothetical protein